MLRGRQVGRSRSCRYACTPFLDPSPPFSSHPAAVFPNLLEVEIAPDRCPRCFPSRPSRHRRNRGKPPGNLLTIERKLRRTSAMRAAAEPASSAAALGGGRNKAIIPSASAAIIRYSDRCGIEAFSLTPNAVHSSERKQRSTVAERPSLAPLRGFRTGIRATSSPLKMRPAPRSTSSTSVARTLGIELMSLIRELPFSRILGAQRSLWIFFRGPRSPEASPARAPSSPAAVSDNRDVLVRLRSLDYHKLLIRRRRAA
jgi:hypothetical protein